MYSMNDDQGFDCAEDCLEALSFIPRSEKVAFLKNANQIFPDNIKLMFALAEEYTMRGGRFDQEAETLFQEANALAPTNIHVLEGWAELKKKQRQFEAADAILLEGVRAHDLEAAQNPEHALTACRAANMSFLARRMVSLSNGAARRGELSFDRINEKYLNALRLSHHMRHIGVSHLYHGYFKFLGMAAMVNDRHDNYETADDIYQHMENMMAVFLHRHEDDMGDRDYYTMAFSYKNWSLRDGLDDETARDLKDAALCLLQQAKDCAPEKHAHMRPKYALELTQWPIQLNRSLGHLSYDEHRAYMADIYQSHKETVLNAQKADPPSHDQ